MRLAFTLFGDDSWTGGLNYLRNLFSAIAELPHRAVEPVLFVAPGTPGAALDALTPFLGQVPVVVEGWRNSRANRVRRLFQGAILQCDYVSLAAFRAQRIDAVFQNDAWYGLRFPLPTLVWIADFQHRHLPEMFSRYRRMKRDLGYAVLCRSASRVMVSSEDARRDCESFFTGAQSRVAVVPFAVRMDDAGHAVGPVEVRSSYGLPERYLYLPGQLWRHKNHLAVVDALCLLRDEGSHVVVVATGNPKDRRNPDHPQRLLDRVKREGLDAHFRFLGMVPYAHINPLMRGAVALLNPSLFEGWSTTVEEAKALGVPLLLSDLQLHREQAVGKALFFDPRSPRAMADAFKLAWNTWQTGPDSDRERAACASYRIARGKFASRFVDLVKGLRDGR